VLYARVRGANRSVLAIIEPAAEGYLEALDLSERMWWTILASPGRAEPLAAGVAA
jgi:hypothetical protein